MLPETLSEEIFSLRQGETRPVVSCFAHLSAEGDVQSSRLELNLVKVEKRLTYQQVDQRLREHDNYFCQLYDIAMAANRQRADSGACFLPLPEVNINVDEHWQVSVEVMERDGPAREMVAETAILANRLKGEFMAASGLPSLYRVQARPRELWQNLGPEALFANFSRRRLLQRVEVSLSPGLHAGLGLSNYTHATSPIRRYLDLLSQRQLIAGLRGQAPPLDGPQLLEIAQETEVNLRAAGRVLRARQRYWLLKWLEERQGQTMPALLLEQQLRVWQILIKPIMLIASLNTQARGLMAGQEIAIKVLRADAFEDSLRLELA